MPVAVRWLGRRCGVVRGRGAFGGTRRGRASGLRRELTAFLRHYLSLYSGVLGSAKHVSARFCDHIERDVPTPAAFEAKLQRLQYVARIYPTRLRPANAPHAEIRAAMERLAPPELLTTSPFLLAVADAYLQGHITRADYPGCWATLENYLVRRFITGEPSNFLNKLW